MIVAELWCGIALLGIGFQIALLRVILTERNEYRARSLNGVLQVITRNHIITAAWRLGLFALNFGAGIASLNFGPEPLPHRSALAWLGLAIVGILLFAETSQCVLTYYDLRTRHAVRRIVLSVRNLSEYAGQEDGQQANGIAQAAEAAADKVKAVAADTAAALVEVVNPEPIKVEVINPDPIDVHMEER